MSVEATEVVEAAEIARDAAVVPSHPSSAAADVPLGRNRDFLILLSGQGMSGLGDAVSFTAMPLLVLQLTGSGLALGIVGVLGRLPDLLFGLPAGALADRVDRRRLMLISDAGRAALTALIPLSIPLGIDTMAVVLLVTFPINVLRVIFMAGWTGAVPNLVGRRMLGRAVGMVEGLISLSFIVGPALAGLLVGIIGASETLAINAVGFAISAATLLLIHRPFQAERSDANLGIRREIAEGISFIARHPVLRLAVGAWTFGGIIVAGLISALTYSITIDRGLSPADLGFILSAYGVGNLLGAVGGGRITHGRLAPPLIGGYMIQAFAIIVVGIPAGLPIVVLLLASFAGGLGSGFTIVSYLTYRAAVTPDRLLGRVGSTARTISIGLQPIGVFATGVLLDAIGGNVTVLLTGAALLVMSVVFGLSPTLRAARGDSHSAEA